MPLSRRKAREQAFFLIFESSFRDDSAPDIIEAAVEARDYESDEFTDFLVNGVAKSFTMTDALMEPHINNRSITRLSKVTLSLLRLAIFEILFAENIPVSVSINEAVELAKTYGGEDDFSFVNGVLGNIVRTLENGNV